MLRECTPNRGLHITDVNFDALKDLAMSDDALKDYYMIFNHIDADKSGSVSKEEIRQYIEEFAQEDENESTGRSNMRLSKLMEYMDTHSVHHGAGDVEIDFRAFAYLMDQADVIFDEKFHRLEWNKIITAPTRVSVEHCGPNAADRGECDASP